jgi:hypothetical protein
MSEKSYYKEKLPDLIERLKSMVDKNMDLIDADIKGDLSEDKNHAVLKGRKMAAEDAVWAMKKIDELEDEYNGVEATGGKKKSWAKIAAGSKEE